MYHHVKKLMYTVRVDEPDPKFGNMLLEQFGGANGELAAAMQYSMQGLNCEDPARKDLLMDIGTEELSHLEVVGTLARLHLAPMKFKRDAAEADPLIAIAGGGGVNLFNSMGNAWTADYLKVTGELDVDLRSNIAAEARAKIVYERLINFCDDVGTKDALQFLMTREITHMKAFAAALDSMGKPRFAIGKIAPSKPLVNQYFNDSTGEGDHGEIDAKGPWNEGDGLEVVEAPAFQERGRTGPDRESNRKRPTPPIRRSCANSLSISCAICCTPKSSWSRRCPKWPRLPGPLPGALLEPHLQETEEQVERLTEESQDSRGSYARKAVQGHDGPPRRGRGGHAEG